MSDSPDNACSNPEISALEKLAEKSKVEFAARLSQDLASQSPAETLRFFQQLKGCLDQERPNHPTLPHIDIQIAPRPNTQSI